MGSRSNAAGKITVVWCVLSEACNASKADRFNHSVYAQTRYADVLESLRLKVNLRCGSQEAFRGFLWKN